MDRMDNIDEMDGVGENNPRINSRAKYPATPDTKTSG